jgi:signal transduction histidine kinase
MTTTGGAPAEYEPRFARLAERLAALGRHRVLVGVLVAAAVAGALVLDVRFVSYPIAGFYLVPVTLAALTLRVRETILVALVCLALAIYIIVVQDRLDGPTITVVAFSALGGAALIALSYLFTQVGRLYETERFTSERLESLAAQLQTLQEVMVLDTDRPLSELLGEVIAQAGQLLGSDGCCVYRYEPETAELRVAAATGVLASSGAVPLADHDDPMVRALTGHEPVAVTGDGEGGALLAVPLLVRNEGYGVLSLGYRERREFSDLDVRLAASFGAEVAMAIENARLRDEIGQTAAATERSRLARDLHDSVTQSLFAASLKAEAIRRRWEPTSEEARTNVQDVERLARGALAEMRTLLMEMRPDTLAGASLPTLIEQLAAAAGGSSRLEVHLDVRPGELPRRAVSEALFRIAQESLQNVSRHSGANEAWVMLDMSGSVVRLSVRDDGHGFDEATVTPEHFGLAIMRERASDAGVDVSVESEPGRGTTVSAEWRRDGRED